MSDRPNIVFILADDLGYADLGCTGSREAVSPNLDRLAAQGLLLTHGYANSALCSPSRFALITGRYQYRLRGAAGGAAVRQGERQQHARPAARTPDAAFAAAGSRLPHGRWSASGTWAFRRISSRG